jgi:hypothetical protein
MPAHSPQSSILRCTQDVPRRAQINGMKAIFSSLLVSCLRSPFMKSARQVTGAAMWPAEALERPASTRGIHSVNP